jgi:sigma-B regulation protein RsbU (phosphoserine phosphatase)
MQRARVWALLVVAGPLAYEIGHSIDGSHSYLVGAKVPFIIERSTGAVKDPTDATVQAGLQKGDRVVRLGGEAYREPAQIHRLIRQARRGDTLRVTYSRAGAPPREAVLVLEPAHKMLEKKDWVIAFLVDLLIRWVGLALGVFVVLMRPRDPLAYLVFALLAAFGQLATGVGGLPLGWPQPWRALGMAYSPMVSIAWSGILLLFGLYFPDPRTPMRRLLWTRWVVCLPIFVFAVAVAGVAALDQMGVTFPDGLDRALNAWDRVHTALAMTAVSMFFFCLGWKKSREPEPDARRRLALLMWGIIAGIAPLFVFLITRAVIHADPADRFPALLYITMGGLVLFPLTFVYVIVVERAMDVRVVLRQGLQYALAQRAVRMLTALLLTAVMYLTVRTLEQPDVRRAARMQAIAFSVLTIMVLQRGAGRARTWLDKRFFRDQVEAEALLAGLGQELRHVSAANELRERVCARIAQSMHVGKVAIVDEATNGWALTLPLTVGAEAFGYLALGSKLNEEPYSRRDRELLESAAAQTALALDHARLTETVAAAAAQRERAQRELEIAREVQERLFPHNPPGIAGLDYTGVCRPAQSVGGDYYDFFLTPDGVLTMAIGDICGKGVAAALLMANLQASLRGLCAGGVRDLGELMERLNTLVYDATPRNRFATLWCAQYDSRTRRLRHASAGHPEAVLLRASGATELLRARGVGLGLVRQASYGFGEIALAPGDQLAVCTDGITEARSETGEEFGEPAWTALVEETRGQSAADMIGHILGRLDTFAAGAEQHDDITLVAARVL